MRALGFLVLTGALMLPAASALADSATVTAVGTLYTHTNQPSLAQETIAVSPAAVGNVLALAVETKFPPGSSFTAASVSGGGVSAWTRSYSSLMSDGTHGADLWWGVITAIGPATITVDYTAGSTSGDPESATSLDVQEFASSAGAATAWSVDGVGKVDTGFASTAPSYPTLTPASPGEAYFGYLAVPGAVGAGSTPGVVYQVDSRGNQSVYAAPISTTITPIATGSSQTFFSVGMLLCANQPAGSPTVTGVSPGSGPSAGGMSVQISGTNLSGATGVRFGSTPGAITSNSATTIVATSPARSAGTVDITVTTAAGTSTISTADQFTYADPKTSQVITFTSTPPTAARVGGPSYTPTAQATSGLAVSVTVDATAATVCSISGPTVSFIRAGTCVIDANQAGDSTYNPAPQVQQAFAVGKGTVTLIATSMTAMLHASVPRLTASGAVPGGTAGTLTCTTTAPVSSGRLATVGGYPITCGGYANPNYDFTYVPGTLSVVYRTSGFSSPSYGSTWRIGSVVPVRFSLTDVFGTRISDTEAAALVAACRVTFSATGPATAGPVCMSYSSRRFFYSWTIPGAGTGTETLVTTITYPNTAVKTVLTRPIKITL